MEMLAHKNHETDGAEKSFANNTVDFCQTQLQCSNGAQSYVQNWMEESTNALLDPTHRLNKYY